MYQSQKSLDMNFFSENWTPAQLKHHNYTNNWRVSEVWAFKLPKDFGWKYSISIPTIKSCLYYFQL